MLYTTGTVATAKVMSSAGATAHGTFDIYGWHSVLSLKTFKTSIADPHGVGT
jgi:hypothetical protein